MRRDHTDRPQNPNRNRQVERGAALAHVRRRQIHGDRVLVEQHAEPGQRTRDAHARLAHRGFGEPHHLKERRPAGGRDLDLDRMRVETDQRARLGNGQPQLGPANGRGVCSVGHAEPMKQ